MVMEKAGNGNRERNGKAQGDPPDAWVEIQAGPAHLAFCSGRVTPVLPILLMGASNSLVPTVMWPSVARIVPSCDLGKAYGLMAWSESLGLGGCNLLIGWVHDRARAGAANPHGYQAGMELLSVLTLLGLLSTLCIHRRRLQLPLNIH